MEGKSQEIASPDQVRRAVDKGQAPRIEVASLLYLTR